MTEYSEGQPFLGIPKDDGSQNPPPVYYDRSSTPTMVSKKITWPGKPYFVNFTTSALLFTFKSIFLSDSDNNGQ